MRETSRDIGPMASEVVRCSGGSEGTIYAALRDAYQMGRYGLTYTRLKELQEKEAAAWKASHPGEAVI